MTHIDYINQARGHCAALQFLWRT